MVVSDLRKNNISPQVGRNKKSSLLLSPNSKMLSVSPNGSPKMIRQKSSSSPNELKVELNDYQLYGYRRNSTYFTNGSTSYENDFEDGQPDYKEQFRQTMLQMYAETGRRRSGQYADLKQRKFEQRLQRNELLEGKENQSKFYFFVKYMVTEHEHILQLLIFLPLILTSLYIVCVEEKPLFTT
uniref:Uncharacterized protein n=1 Tax=Clytia hemisphaerica TaxID=252671 RepID=A0A7M5X1V4_9CNID|eukprot:TCONS_00070421-protein